MASPQIYSSDTSTQSLKLPEGTLKFFQPTPGLAVESAEGVVRLYVRPPGLSLVVSSLGFLVLVAAFGVAWFTGARLGRPAGLPWPVTVMAAAALLLGGLGPIVIWFLVQRHHSRRPAFLVKDERSGYYSGRYFDRPVRAASVVGLDLLKFIVKQRSHSDGEAKRPLMLRIRTPERGDEWLLVIPSISARQARATAVSMNLPLAELNLPRMIIENDRIEV